MILLSPTRAATAIGVQCKDQTGKGEEVLLELLLTLTARIAAALDVTDLTYGTYTDTFMVRTDRTTAVEVNQPLRLARGFLTSPSVTITGADEAVVQDVDTEKGIVYLSSLGWVDGLRLQVTYTAGFDVPPPSPDVHADPLYRTGIGVPDWLEGILAAFLLNQRRSLVLPAQAPKEYGLLPTLNESLLMDLRSRIYKRYERRRDGVYFPRMSVKV